LSLPDHMLEEACSTTHSSNSLASLVSPRKPGILTKKGSKRHVITPKQRQKAALKVKKHWEKSKGLLTVKEANKLIKLYDSNDDGLLDLDDAKPLLMDIVNVCGLRDTILSFKPLVDDTDGFLLQFCTFAFNELDYSKAQSVNPYALILDGGFGAFMEKVFEKKKYELNPTRKLMEEEKKRQAESARVIDVTMMQYEFNETLAGLLDQDDYQSRYVQPKEKYQLHQC